MAALDAAAMEKEQKLRDDLLNLRWLYDTHKREDNSPTREYNLLQMLKLISRKEKQLESILGVREAKQIQEEIFTEELVIDSLLESISESIMDSFNSEEVKDCSQDSSIPSEAKADEILDELIVPCFLFADEMDDSQITAVANAKVNDVDSEYHVQMKEVSYENLESLRELVMIHIELNCKDFFTLLFDFTRSLFDRGKKTQLSSRNSYFAKYYDKLGSKFDAYLKILDGYYRELVQELIHKHGYWSYSFYSDPIACMLVKGCVSSIAWHMFGNILEMNTVCLKSNTKVSRQYPSKKPFYSCFNLPGKVFDRGKGLVIGRYPSGIKNSSKFCLDLLNSCLSIITMVDYIGIYVSVLINKRGVRLGSLSMNFILLVLFNMGGYDDGGKLFVEMSQSGNLKLFDQWTGTLREECLWVQLQYELLDAAILHLISFRVLSQSARYEVVHKFVSFACLTIILQGLFALHWWDLFHRVPFFYVHHGPWFGQFFRASYTSVRDISLQMTEVLSSECVNVLAWIVETQILLMVIHILDILMLVDYLRWKHKLLTSGNYESPAIREEAKKVHLNSAKLTTYVHHMWLPWVTDDVGFMRSDSLMGSTKLEFLALVSGIHDLLMVFQILKLLLWVGYLRWKFRMVSTRGWSVKIFSCMHFPFKLKQNLKWLVFVVPVQGCTPVKANGKSLGVIQAGRLITIEMLKTTCVRLFCAASLVDSMAVHIYSRGSKRGSELAMRASYMEDYSTPGMQLTDWFNADGVFIFGSFQVHENIYTTVTITGILYLFLIFVSVRWVYDRGKVFDVLKGDFSFVDTYGFGIYTVASCELAHVGSILLDSYKEVLVNELDLKHSSQVELLVDTCVASALLIVSNVINNKMIAALPERNKFLLLMLARVLTIKKVHKGSVQMLERNEAEFFFLQLTCNSFEVDFFRVIVDSQEDEVHQILLHEFQVISVLIFSVDTIYRTRIYLSRINTFHHSSLPTSEVFWWYVIQEGVIMTIAHSNRSSLHSSCRVGYSTYILVWVAFMKWKYKLYFTGLLSARNVG